MLNAFVNWPVNTGVFLLSSIMIGKYHHLFSAFTEGLVYQEFSCQTLIHAIGIGTDLYYSFCQNLLHKGFPLI